ncbi:MAG: hypothetical protein AAFZ89_03635 [Bacteroidota bacterium]
MKIQPGDFNFFFAMLFTFFWTAIAYTQLPVAFFKAEDHDSVRYAKYGTNKKIPKEIRNQALTALSFYPELKPAKVVFRLRKRKTPLASRPQIWSVFKKKKNRTYVITISTKSNEQLSPILFFNLPYNAQIGVLGHELGHTAEYNTKSTFQLIGLSFKLLKSKNTDAFEFNTDRICIAHGLGYQLYDWSAYVRKVLNITVWRGADNPLPQKNAPIDQRYMNPETIEKFIKEDPIYRNMD